MHQPRDENGITIQPGDVLQRFQHTRHRRSYYLQYVAVQYGRTMYYVPVSQLQRLGRTFACTAEVVKRIRGSRRPRRKNCEEE